MTTEVWFRNPSNYIRELIEVRGNRVAWDRGHLQKRKIDAYAHAKLYFSQAGIADWRIMLIGEQGSVELGPNNPIDDPIGVYPTWTGAEDLELLEEMMSDPVGENLKFCNDPNIARDERPVYGQQHRVIVTELPPMNSGPGKALARKLIDLQEDYPDCIMHVHGLYSWRTMFGLGFAAVDMDPRTSAQKGRIFIPPGKEIKFELAIGTPQWISLLGFTMGDLRDPKARCKYNMKSALWSGEHYMENIKFKSTGRGVANTETKKFKPVETEKPVHGALPVKEGDKMQCDTCSLQSHCKYYRQGAVCSVPGSEPSKLASYFKTRDAESIIDGLGTLLQAQTRRMEKGMSDEELFGELDPEVTKLMNQIFNNGVKLAKLVDPNLAGGAKVQVNVGGNAQQITASTPNQMIGSIVRELEARGVPRDKITPEMIQGLLAEMSGSGNGASVIEGHVLEAKSDQ